MHGPQRPHAKRTQPDHSHASFDQRYEPMNPKSGGFDKDSTLTGQRRTPNDPVASLRGERDGVSTAVLLSPDVFLVLDMALPLSLLPASAPSFIPSFAGMRCRTIGNLALKMVMRPQS